MQTGRARLLLMLSLALCTTSDGAAVGQTIPISREALFSAVQGYNRNSGLDSAFGVLEVRVGDPSNPDLQNLGLILKETTCPNSEDLNLDDCDFKEDGELKECSGTSSGQPGSSVQIQCRTIPPGGNHRVKRHEKGRKFFRKLKKLLTGGGSLIGQIKSPQIYHVA